MPRHTLLVVDRWESCSLFHFNSRHSVRIVSPASMGDSPFIFTSLFSARSLTDRLIPGTRCTIIGIYSIFGSSQSVCAQASDFSDIWTFSLCIHQSLFLFPLLFRVSFQLSIYRPKHYFSLHLPLNPSSHYTVSTTLTYIILIIILKMKLNQQKGGPAAVRQPYMRVLGLQPDSTGPGRSKKCGFVHGPVLSPAIILRMCMHHC